MTSAVDREIAWYLATVSSLPALHTTDDGPFEVVSAYWPRDPGRIRGLWLTRRPAVQRRYAIQRVHHTHTLIANLRWPTDSATGDAQADQRAFDDAVDKVLARILGPVGDKTHGGRFLQAGEDPAEVTVEQPDALELLRRGEPLTATITYDATDQEITG